MGGDSPGDNASSDVLRIEHLIIFGLLCMMVMFIFRVLIDLLSPHAASGTML